MGAFPPYYSISNDVIYDRGLAEGVKFFQKHYGLTPDGVLGEQTLKELNTPPVDRIQKLQVNLQRWQHIAERLPSRFILVNVPDFHLFVYENNSVLFSMKAIVGKSDLPTPEIASTITRIVFNPPWNIPNSIAQNDIIPKIEENPNYLTENNIRILKNGGDDLSEVSPDEVDWGADFNYHFKQDPGPQNPLGLVKFEFYNTEDVYLHDTPAKSLFDKNERALSHGCVRLERAFALVPYLMNDDPEWDEDKINGIINSGETTFVKAARPTPIYISYFTAWVDDSGFLNFRPDVYERDEFEPSFSGSSYYSPLDSVVKTTSTDIPEGTPISPGISGSPGSKGIEGSPGTQGTPGSPPSKGTEGSPMTPGMSGSPPSPGNPASPTPVPPKAVSQPL